MNPGFSLLNPHNGRIRDPSQQELSLIYKYFPGIHNDVVYRETNALILLCDTLPPLPRPVLFADVPICFTTYQWGRGFADDLHISTISPGIMSGVEFPGPLGIPLYVLDIFAQYCMLNEIPLHSLGASIGGSMIVTLKEECDVYSFPSELCNRPLFYRFEEEYTVLRNGTYILRPPRLDFTSWTHDFALCGAIETPNYGQLLNLDSPDDGLLTGYVSRTEYEMVLGPEKDRKGQARRKWVLLLWIPLFYDGGVPVSAPSIPRENAHHDS